MASESFRHWLLENHGYVHPSVEYSPVSSGFAILAREALTIDTTVVTCPFNLAITPEISKQALDSILAITPSEWTERQLICSYLVFCLIKQNELEELTSGTLGGFTVHAQYISTLPIANKLLTPLHFTADELESFKGTNLYGATSDRRISWDKDWKQCQKIVSVADRYLAEQFTWDRYLTASTYLSSRAFPSTLLSNTPSVQQSDASHPILLPGIDALNHARGQPVSWVVSTRIAAKEPTISLVLHSPVPAGSELFNNYGAKPNSEFILGYGFSLVNNPDDTIVLKIGGRGPSASEPKKWEVGRNAAGAEGLYTEILHSVAEDASSLTYEDHLDAAQMLMDMVHALLVRLPRAPPVGRTEVATMWHDYVGGQRDILNSLIQFARQKELTAIQNAREEGVELVFEDGDE